MSLLVLQYVLSAESEKSEMFIQLLTIQYTSIFTYLWFVVNASGFWTTWRPVCLMFVTAIGVERQWRNHADVIDRYICVRRRQLAGWEEMLTAFNSRILVITKPINRLLFFVHFSIIQKILRTEKWHVLSVPVDGSCLSSLWLAIGNSDEAVSTFCVDICRRGSPVSCITRSLIRWGVPLERTN